MTIRRLVELEALRGLAAIVVLINHLLVAFYPKFHGLRFPQEPLSLYGTPLFALVNGSAAVVLFFVLSGFVLTVGSFRDKSCSSLIVGALKRWPRLVVPILAVNLISGALAGSGYYWNAVAASDIGSAWLGAFFKNNLGFWESIATAATEGSFLTFIASHDYYNSNLWTMYYEFFGSFACFGIAGAMVLCPRFAWLICASAVAVTAWFFDPYFICFPAGTCLAYFYNQPSWKVFATWFAQHARSALPAAIIVVIILFAYHESSDGIPRAYAPIALLYQRAPLHLRVILHGAGSLLLIVSVLGSPVLGARLRGSFGAGLGRYSFPLYLVQVPVICSVGAGTYVLLASSLPKPAALFLGFLTSAVAVFLFAFPLVMLEERWLARLRLLTKKLSSSRQIHEGSADVT